MKKKFSDVENSRPVLDQLNEINSQFGISTVKVSQYLVLLALPFLVGTIIKVNASLDNISGATDA